VLLETVTLTKHFGGLVAVSNVDIRIAEGEMVGIIGPNGAGKTTLFNLMTGLIRPTKGRINYKGRNIVGQKPHVIAKMGIGRTFQLNPLFADFTVLQNVAASFYLQPKSSLLAAFLNLPSYRRNEAYISEKSMEIIELLGLDKVRDELAKNLPQGYQKMLGIARALATRPELLLLDDPLGGLSTICRSWISWIGSMSSISGAKLPPVGSRNSGKTKKSSKLILEPDEMLLEVDNITVKYGKAIAVEAVSIKVPEGKVVTIIGANGAGKSTILKALSGLTPLVSGKIIFDGQRIDGLKPYEIVERGLVHVPEGRKLFPYLPVMNNLKLGASLRKDKEGTKKDLEEVFNYFPRLWERRKQKAGTLSGGEQQMLAIGRGLMANPRLLLMDEPSLGLAPILVAELVPVIKNINKKGISFLLVEQNMPLALSVADWGYALQVGKVVLEGDIEEFKANGIVKRAYLGG
jgi:branched-chain amino acid transport system ATP-binding protein